MVGVFESCERGDAVSGATCRPDYKGLLYWLLEQLRSDQYLCPGEHGDAPHTGERHYEQRVADWEADTGYVDPRQGSCALCGCTTYFDTYPVWAEGGPPLPEGYRGPGQCPGRITLQWDYEVGEFGSVLGCYPVADGACAEALGLDDDPGDGEWAHPVYERMAERTRLLKALERQARHYRVPVPRARR